MPIGRGLPRHAIAQAGLHVAGGLDRRGRLVEHADEAVADLLGDAPAVGGDRLFEQFKAAAHFAKGRLVAKRFIQTGAVADVDEQYGQIFPAFGHDNVAGLRPFALDGWFKHNSTPARRLRAGATRPAAPYAGAAAVILWRRLRPQMPQT